ncbi:MAG TPA: TetR/AcrR family transcriptional regulator [Pseudonocardiaceae bacterium]|nr:TetR/AcrR family transcriptional regulator [Pseudonocardiaceae bacterium]
MTTAEGASQETYRLLWESPTAPRRGPKPTLTLAAIAAAGVELADEEGLAAVTMQHIAAALGVTKMALYRYLPGKVELVALMTEAAMGEAPSLDMAGWRPKLHEWARRLFAGLVRHPWLADTTVGARVIGPHELGWTEQAVAALIGTGLRGAEILDVVATLAGHAKAIAQQAAAAGAQTAEAGLTDAIGTMLRGREDRFPALVATLDALAREGGQDDALDFGLTRILDGVELLVTARGQGSDAG